MMDFIYILAQATLDTGQQIENLPTVNPDKDFVTGSLLPFIFGLLGALSVLFVIIGGFKYVISAGNPEATNKAKDTIIYALIGLVVSLLSFTIVSFIINAINPPESGSNPIFGSSGIITQVAQWLVYAIGVISVVMIVYGAFRFTVSAGDPNSTKTARDVIIYSVVGLIVAISAQAIVTFVLESL